VKSHISYIVSPWESIATKARASSQFDESDNATMHAMPKSSHSYPQCKGHPSPTGSDTLFSGTNSFKLQAVSDALPYVLLELWYIFTPQSRRVWVRW
jgi:hypothetical protein